MCENFQLQILFWNRIRLILGKKHHERSSQLLQQTMEPSKFQVCDLCLLQRLRRQPQVLRHLFSWLHGPTKKFGKTNWKRSEKRKTFAPQRRQSWSILRQFGEKKAQWSKNENSIQKSRPVLNSIWSIDSIDVRNMGDGLLKKS